MDQKYISNRDKIRIAEIGPTLNEATQARGVTRGAQRTRVTRGTRVTAPCSNTSCACALAQDKQEVKFQHLEDREISCAVFTSYASGMSRGTAKTEISAHDEIVSSRSSLIKPGEVSDRRAPAFKDACVLYPSSLSNPKEVDEHFREEYEAAKRVGMQVAIVDDVSLRQPGSLRLGSFKDRQLFYRGWMLNEQEFSGLEKSILQAHSQLLTDTDDYLQAHYLPNWYPLFAEHTPFSVWGTADDPETLLAELPSGAAIVKDYVKSFKHLWDEACYIRNTEDTVDALRVINKFKELRIDIQGGLILRHYEPLGDEYRSWWRDGECRLISAHPDTPELLPPDDLDMDFLRVNVSELDARMVTIDLAKNTSTGDYRIVEIGDGMVSDRPQCLDPEIFYQQLFLTD